MPSNIEISIVIPVYGCKECLIQLHSRLNEALSKITEYYEIILVNDCSPDQSWDVIKHLCEWDTKVIGINLSRNFGQHSALTAGLDYAKGDWIVVMDCDLQDQPEEIVKLYQKAQEGYDIVLGKRMMRKDNIFKRITSKIFYKVFNYLTNTKTDHTVGTFRIMSKKVVKNFNAMREQLRFFGGMISWMGFKTTSIDIVHMERNSGKSSYNLRSLMKLALTSMVSFSEKPLMIFVKVGFSMSLLSVMYAIYLVFQKVFNDIIIEGWTSIIVSMYFLSGMLFMNLGVVGFYIGKILHETKKRPLYIVDELVNYE